MAKKDARSYYAFECTECKQRDGKSRENHFASINKNNDKDKKELKKYCPTCKKHTIHREKK